MENNNKITTRRVELERLTHPFHPQALPGWWCAVATIDNHLARTARISHAVMFSLAWFRINKCFIKIKYTHNNNRSLGLHGESSNNNDKEAEGWRERKTRRRLRQCECMLISYFVYSVLGKNVVFPYVVQSILSPSIQLQDFWEIRHKFRGGFENIFVAWNNADICKSASHQHGYASCGIIVSRGEILELWTSVGQKSCRPSRVQEIIARPRSWAKVQMWKAAKLPARWTRKIRKSPDRHPRDRRRPSSRPTATSRWVIISLSCDRQN